MAQYHVRDTFGYVTVVEADKYVSNIACGSFDFLAENGEKIASFLCNSTVSIIEADTAFQDIFLVDAPETDDLDPEETDDVCFDCRVGELLDSEVFFDAVVGVIDAYCCPDEDTPSEQPEEAKIPSSSVLKGVRKKGKVAYGFLTPEGFVNYDVGLDSDAECIEMAKEGLSDYLSGERSWHYEEPEDYTFSKIDPPTLTVLKATDKEGNVFYGFIAENGKFVDFSGKDYAEYGLASYRKDGVRGWNYRNPSDFVFEEVDNG